MAHRISLQGPRSSCSRLRSVLRTPEGDTGPDVARCAAIRYARGVAPSSIEETGQPAAVLYLSLIELDRFLASSSGLCRVFATGPSTG
jgi:hypothetical protein